MTDEELLRLAARAASMGDVHVGDREHGGWDPLSNDGDALKLVVKLKLDVLVHDKSAEVYCGVRGQALIREGCDGSVRDRSRATRRAIVRAAAALAGPGRRV